MSEPAGRLLVARQRVVRQLLDLLVAYGILPILLVVLYVVFGLVEPRFHSLDNFLNILRQASYLIILATAQMMALITRGFDLSVGTVVSMVSVTTALIMVSIIHANPEAVGLSMFLGILFGLGVGLAVGLFNGACVAYLKVNPFVVTLGMQGIALGFATTLSGGFPVFDVPIELTNMFSRATVIGIPVQVIVAAIVLAGAYVVLNHTVLGRALYILGGNPRAAHVAGLRSRFYLMMAYVLCSFIVGVGALLLTARTGSGEPNLGGGLMLQSIAAAVIGGVSLRGGEGRIIHCIIGGLFVTVLAIGMNMLRIDSYVQMMILGIVVIFAIFIDRLRAQIR